jgi:ribulose-5-phosphate 4-epimerase/fuculose-1-phosphate aldolase
MKAVGLRYASAQMVSTYSGSQPRGPGTGEGSIMKNLNYLLAGGLTLLLAGFVPAYAQTVAPVSAGRVDLKLIEDLVAANRILAAEGILDGWGHVSVRHPNDPTRYLMSRNLAAELVTGTDIMEYDLDSVPVDRRGRDMYTERFIHGEIYKARPDVNAVVHTHAPPLIPFTVTKVPMRPMYHRAAFVALGIPVFEIREGFGMTDMLVRNQAHGQALAKSIADKPAALMRGHGAIVVAPSLPRLVGRTVFLVKNATLQQQALALGGPITYLDAEEARLIEAREGYGLARQWEAWKRKLE